MVLKRMLWLVTCPNHASFRLLTVSRKKFLWTHKEVDLASRPVVGLVLQAEDTENFGSLYPFFRVSKQGPCFTAIEEDEGDKRLVKL